MKLYSPVSIKTFINDNAPLSGSNSFHFYLANRLAEKFEQEYLYGLSLLRQAIKAYEDSTGIEKENSKVNIPFFRENQNLLAGPELHLYSTRLYESDETCPQDPESLIITFNYEKLGEHCIVENLFLSKCKYDKEQSIRFFEKQLETEYDKFFYSGEYFGFAKDSLLFSMLCNACLEIREPERSEQKEWYIASLQMPEDANYTYRNGRLESFSCTQIPFDAIEQISMPCYKGRKDEYTALAGLLKQKGLKPGNLLEGYE